MLFLVCHSSCSPTLVVIGKAEYLSSGTGVLRIDEIGFRAFVVLGLAVDCENYFAAIGSTEPLVAVRLAAAACGRLPVQLSPVFASQVPGQLRLFRLHFVSP